MRMAATLTRKPGTTWADAWQRSLAAAPEAFRDDRVLNLWDGRWHADGHPLPAVTPVDGTPIAGPPRLDAATARQAVRASLDQHRAWRHIALPERRARVAATLDALAAHRELLASSAPPSTPSWPSTSPPYAPSASATPSPSSTRPTLSPTSTSAP